MNTQHETSSTPNPISGSTDTLAMLTFTVGEQVYGLPVANVVRIIEMITITRLPGAPDIIKGIINVQGKTVPVIDVRHRFGLPARPYGAHTPIILTDPGRNERTIGLIVDTVQDVLSVASKNLEMTEMIVPPGLEQQITGQAAYLAGVAKVAQQLIVVLNARALLSLTEQTKLLQAINSDGRLKSMNAPNK